MSASDNFEADLILGFFNATAWANVFDNAASSPVTNWQLGLHTASPGESGNQTSNEIAYTSYARVAKARTSGGFTCSTNSASLASNADFPAGTGGSGTATDFSIGNSSSGTGRLQISGSISPSIVCGNGVTPRLTTSTAISID